MGKILKRKRREKTQTNIICAYIRLCRTSECCIISFSFSLFVYCPSHIPESAKMLNYTIIRMQLSLLYFLMPLSALGTSKLECDTFLYRRVVIINCKYSSAGFHVLQRLNRFYQFFFFFFGFGY
jgi:hypothetical protein